MKNRNISKLFYITIIPAFIIILFMVQAKPQIAEYVYEQQTDTTKWVAPEWADTLKNPFAGSIKATNEGKKLFQLYCVTCHGEEGKGNGPTAASLNPHPADLALKSVQKQTDGSFFWKITTGKPPMISWKYSLTKNQRWELVDYIRQLAKK